MASETPRTDALNNLFAKYPSLRAKLRSIYEATQDSEPKPGSQTGGRSRFERGWSEEKGFARGMALLQQELESNVTDSDGLRAFAAYIAANSG